MALSSTLLVSASASHINLVDPQLAQFLDAGGSLDDLCLSDHETSHDHDCPFCREIDIFALDALHPVVIGNDTSPQKARFPNEVFTTLSAPFHPWSARGPPVVRI
jgi:hypothetical protein